MLHMILAKNHEQRLQCVEAAMDWIAQEHSKTRQHRHGRDEDALTTDIITDLKAIGFTAHHDTDYGGHCDIVIEARDDFLWIGEAKIHKGYDWLLKGFQQLDTRYSTGLRGQDNGGLIIYCKTARVDQIMGIWRKRLSKSRADVEIETCKDNVFRSKHIHKSTGNIFTVCHLPISLYFKPEDK